MTGPRVLLTGASGFVGRRLVRRLLADGHWRLTALARQPAPNKAMPGVERLTTAGTGMAELAAALAGARFDLVIHMAAAGVAPGERDPAVLFQANTAYPVNLLHALAPTPPRAFIMLGSCSEYAPSDPVEGGIPEDAPIETQRLYGATKAAGTIAASAAAAALGIPFACLRAFNVYGPGEAAHRLLPNLLKGFAAGGKVPLSIGTQIRDFIHVDDVADALATVAHAMTERPQISGIHNLCTGQGTSVADFARMAAKAAGANPDRLDFGAMPLRPDDMMWQVGDNSRLRTLFGWTPRLMLEDGLRQAIAEMRP